MLTLARNNLQRQSSYHTVQQTKNGIHKKVGVYVTDNSGLKAKGLLMVYNTFNPQQPYTIQNLTKFISTHWLTH